MTSSKARAKCMNPECDSDLFLAVYHIESSVVRPNQTGVYSKPTIPRAIESSLFVCALCGTMHTKRQLLMDITHVVRTGSRDKQLECTDDTEC